MDVYLPEGKATVDLVAGTITLPDSSTRPLTQAETDVYSALEQDNSVVPQETLGEMLLNALDIVRGVVADSSVTDEEIAIATPVVMTALQAFSGTKILTDAELQRAVAVLARVCEALLLRGAAQQQAVTQTLSVLNGTLLTLNEMVGEHEVILINAGLKTP